MSTQVIPMTPIYLTQILSVTDICIMVVYNIFHISMLMKAVVDPLDVVEPHELQVAKDATYMIKTRVVARRDIKITFIQSLI